MGQWITCAECDRAGHNTARKFIDAARTHWSRDTLMPSLFRFIFTLGVIGGLVFSGLYVLATYFEPEPQVVEHTITGVKIRKK